MNQSLTNPSSLSFSTAAATKAVLLAACALIGTAHASVVPAAPGQKWHLDNVVHTDGGTASGSFAYDYSQSSGTFDIEVDTTPGASFGGGSYRDKIPQSSGNASLLSAVPDGSLDLNGSPFIFMNWVTPLSETLDTVDLNVNGFSYEGFCTDSNCAGANAYRKYASGRVIRLGAQWDNLGNGLDGTTGMPVLAAGGSLTAGATTTVSLSGALPGAMAFLVVGASEQNLPFAQGTLVPSPDIVLPLLVDSSGAIALQAAWPAIVPSSTSFYHQFWVQDAQGPDGYSASNALKSTTP